MAQPGTTLDDLGENGLLAEVFQRLQMSTPDLLLGPGDDTAYLRADGAVLATTDTMVRGRDWRDDWSSPAQVGAKAVVQNLADIAAMGGHGTGMLVTLVAPGNLPARWALEFTDGLADAARAAGVPVIGGDLSSSLGEVMVSITALGRATRGAPVTRSGACVGDLVAVSGPLGRSAAGWWLLQRAGGGEQSDQELAWITYHQSPDPDLSQGPVAAQAGATSMIDISDGLVRDLTRVAAASQVLITLNKEALAPLVSALRPAVQQEIAWECVLGGGEEHVLAGTFAEGAVPAGWTVLGQVASTATDQVGSRVDVDGAPLAAPLGWDHFGG